MLQSKSVDKVLLITVLILVCFGFILFVSASMGILAKDSAQFASVAFKQSFFGLLLGLISCFIFSKIDYKILKKYSFYILIASLGVTAFVFVPGIGLTLNGSTRWIDVFGISFQPIEILNLGFIIYWSAWLSFAKNKIQDFRYGALPLMLILAVISIILIFQPDIDSIFYLGLVGVIMFLSVGGRIRHAIILLLIGLVCVTVLAFSKPYVMDRIKSYFHPGANSLTSGYQIQQSLIAVGSGKMFGRGLGQGIQKFKFLPESIGDSIFAVVGEELGFLGCVSIILAYLFLTFRAMRIANKSPDIFSGLLVIGIVILIVSRSFINIASIIGILPISGVPLAFFSQGGTALLIVLSEIGIILNVSRYTKS